MWSAKQQIRIMKEISKRYPREITVAMSRSEFKNLMNEVGKQLYSC